MFRRGSKNNALMSLGCRVGTCTVFRCAYTMECHVDRIIILIIIIVESDTFANDYRVHCASQGVFHI